MISMQYHLAVLFLISRATGEVPSETNPSSSSTSSTSSPANSNRLLETVPPHRHCPIPENYLSDCMDQNILAGTSCNIFFECPGHSFSIPSLLTCQENSEWADLDSVDKNCASDSCPVTGGFLAYTSGGCAGENIDYYECRDQDGLGGVNCCAAYCQAEETCVSFEVAKREFRHHEEPAKCYISNTCLYANSQKLLNSDTCLYVATNGDNVTPDSNTGGETSHYKHCHPSKVVEGVAEDFLFYGTNCDGNILVGTSCDFWKHCKDTEYSLPGTMVCQEDGSWAGDTLDANCYDTVPEQLTQEDICSDVCSNTQTCNVCYNKVKPYRCPPGSKECNVEISETTAQFVEESKCLSYTMSLEACIASGGDFVVTWEVCVLWEQGQEKCVTRGGSTELSTTHSVTMSASQKACKVFYGYTCDKHSEVIADVRIELVHIDASCPSFQDWSVSCDLLAESNEVTRSNSDPPSVGDDGEDTCLVYDSDISLADGTTQPIHSLEVGTTVALGKDGQSAIIFFSHADKTPVLRNLVTIKTQESTITATRKHLIFSSENEGVTLRNLRAFEEVKVGDYVLMDTEKGPVSTKVIDIIFETILTQLYNPVPRAGYLIANKIFVASGSAFWVLPHWIQFPVVHAVSMLVCGINERACQIEEDDTKPRWVRSVQEWIDAMELKRVSSAMMLTGSYT